MRPTHLLPGLAVAALPLAAAAQAPPGYYSSADASSAAALRASLHAIIDDHVRIPLTSGSTDTWDVLELADQHPTKPGEILDVYGNEGHAKVGGGNPNYEREHLWPSSFGFPDDNASNYPFTDCHGLYLCDGAYNSARANKPFRCCDPGCNEHPTELEAGAGGGAGVYPGNSNWSSGFGTSGFWEVWGGRRGDVARAMLYMDVRYEGGLHGTTGAPEPDLILTNDVDLVYASSTGSNESVAYMAFLSTMLEWHQQDPVDAKEVDRNDAVFAHQGNRNPFVDHPEWVALVFPDPVGAFADPWINELHYDNAGADTGELVEVAGPAGLDLTGWRLIGYASTGDEYATVELAGTIPDLGGCLGTLSFAFDGLQNGPADGVALVGPDCSVVELISYEGTLTAVDGPAFGLTSTDIGVAESSGTAIGTTLQLGGTGIARADFTWQSSSSSTAGTVNNGQTFGDGCAPPPAGPSAPTGLVAEGCVNRVDLTWNANPEPDVAGYRVYRTTTPGFGHVLLTPALVTGTSYADTTVVNGTTYHYAVTAEDTLGVESPLSVEASGATLVAGGGGGDPWINELHYDNSGADAGEFVEVAGPAGTDLTGWKLVGYNGNGGAVYDTVALSGVLPDLGGCTGSLSFAFPGLQNGGPDGVALVDPGDAVVEFLSYEGTFVAVGGAAGGMASTDIGVAESSGTAIGTSLQRGGTGGNAEDFAWQTSQAETPGATNVGQSFNGCVTPPVVAYGCGVNPAGSLTVLSGAPALGTTLTLGVTNPVGTQATGSIPVLVFSPFPDPFFPCGTPVPGFGMSAPGAIGELLVSLGPGFVTLTGAPWAGPGTHASFAIPVPDNCNLLGKKIHVQGALLDPITPGGVSIGLTTALELPYGL